MPRSRTRKTVLVTRSAGQSSVFTDLLLDAGFLVLEMPALEIRPPSSWEPVDSAIAHLADYDWLILTSANAVTYFLDRVQQMGDWADLKAVKLAVVGKKTAKVLAQRGLTPDFIPPNFVADSLVADFPEPVAGQKLLFPRVESGGRDVLVKEMIAAAASVTEVPAYESGCPLNPDTFAIAALKERRVDIVTFASSKTVRHFCQLLHQGLGEDWLTYLETVAIASIGPQTSATCYERLQRVDIKAQEYTLDGLTQAIIRWANALLD
ncbi:MAG: uroporphyrinogen-III synthase [Cyanobacteria bacterium P01_F01_bin.86]